MKKKFKNNVKSIIFDMDGVITNSMPDHFYAWKEVLHSVGINLSHLDVYKREGQRGLASIQEFLEEHNKPCSAEIMQELLCKKEQLFKKIVKQRFVIGSRSFLKFLLRQGFTLALVTGTSRGELDEVLPVNLKALFSVIITSNDVRRGKPDPEPYLLALQRLDISADEAIVIENAPFGIMSARAAGIKCLAVATSLPIEYLKKANKVFGSIRELKEKTAFSFQQNKVFKNKKRPGI